MITVKIEHIQKDQVAPFFEQWEKLCTEIYEMHQNRNKEVIVVMEKGIKLYEQLILFASGQVDSTIRQNEQYEVLPLNGMERLQFIKDRPGQFACFRQLDELFKETKKKIARLRLQKIKTS